MKFPELPETWEALLSDVPIPVLAMHQFGRVQAHQTLTGREERDFLSHNTKISRKQKPTLFPQPDLTETFQTLFPKDEKDHFTKLSKSQNKGDGGSDSQSELGRAGLGSTIHSSISPGSFRGLCAALLSNIHVQLRNHLISYCCVVNAQKYKEQFFYLNTSY